MAPAFKALGVVGAAALALWFFLENAGLLTGLTATAAAFGLVFGSWLAYSKYLSAAFGLDFKETLRRDARSFAPFLALALAGFAGSLGGIESHPGVDVPLMAARLFLKLLLAVALTGMLSLKSLDWPGEVRPRFSPGKAVATAALLYFLVFGVMSLLEYYAFKIPYPDLTYYEQSLWTTVHGRFMENSLASFNYFGSHLSLILLLLVPFYAAFPHTMGLLLLQNFLLAATAFGVYLVGKKLTNRPKVSALFAVAYLLYPAMEFFGTHEFHPVVFAVPFTVFAFHCLLTNRPRLFGLFFVLGLFSKETVALVYAFLGLYAALALKKRRLGAAVFLVSAAWFAFSVFYAIPFFRGEAYAYFGGSENFYAAFGGSAGEIVANVLLDPLRTLAYSFNLKNVGWMAMMLFPVAFLPLAGLDVLLVSLPAIGMNVLAKYYATSTIYFQYNDLIIPLVFLAALAGFTRVKALLGDGKKARAVLAFVFFGSLLSNIFFSPSPLSLLDPLPTQGGFSPERYAVSEADWELHKVIGMIPEGAGVTVNSPQLVAPLSNRFSITPFLTLRDTEYVLVDLGRPGVGKNLEEQKAIAQALAAKWHLETVYASDRVWLLKSPSGKLP